MESHTLDRINIYLEPFITVYKTWLEQPTGIYDFYFKHHLS
jgi:hypothetical protein